MTDHIFQRPDAIASQQAPLHTLLIDDFLPTFENGLAVTTVVNARVRAVYQALLRADLTDSPMVRLLLRLRTLPERLQSLWRRTRGRKYPTTRTFRDIVGPDSPWVVLVDARDEELVVGAVGKVWKPIINWQRVLPESLHSFQTPGYAKIAISLSVRPYGATRSLLTCELRVATTDEHSRRRFARYWSVVEPGARYLMRRAIDGISNHAVEQKESLA